MSFPRAEEFTLAQVLAGGAFGAYSVFGADLDGDGDSDVVSASYSDDTIAWYENTDGLGGFGLQQVITTAADGATSVFATDLDGDGDNDLVSASFNDDKIAWYENQGGLGSFGVQQIISFAADGPQTAIAVDLDGDGDNDVLSASMNDDTIAWYENTDGLGGFGPPQVLTTAADGAVSVFGADLDGDGDQDALSASRTDNTVAWYENADGLGSFGPKQVISAVVEGVFSVFAADLDGDADNDVLFTSYDDDKVGWFKNVDGLGGFGPELIISAAVNGARAACAADLDGDGDYDVLSAAYLDDTVAWYENVDGQGGFGPEEIINAEANGAQAVFSEDLDGDGDNDVLAALRLDGLIGWYENTDGLGAFGAEGPMTAKADGAQSAFAGDLDGDGDHDVLSASSLDDKVAWYENTDGLGSFGFQEIVATTDAASSAIAADLDGDGDNDVLSASYFVDKVAWYENTDGLGGFGPEVTVSTAADGVRSAIAADLDGDGDNDVLAASQWDNTVAWYENTDGLGGFGPEMAVTTAALGARSAIAADLDGDGDNDVLAASYYDDTIAWYENVDGQGGFGPEEIITTAADFAESVFSADLDGDGDNDVLATAGNEGIAWYENAGLGSFGPEQVILTAFGGPDLAIAADLNGDGDNDVLFAWESEDTIARCENTDGLGDFGFPDVITSVAFGARSVFAADLDSDGNADVLSASQDDDKIAWYRNQRPPCSLSLASSEVVRLGSPPNPLALLPGVTSGPVVGFTWDPLVDHSDFLPLAFFEVLIVSALPANLPLVVGTLLCDPSQASITVTSLAGVAFAVPVPAICDLVGLKLYSQAGSLDASFVIALTNALDITIGSF